MYTMYKDFLYDEKNDEWEIEYRAEGNILYDIRNIVVNSITEINNAMREYVERYSHYEKGGSEDE